MFSKEASTTIFWVFQYDSTRDWTPVFRTIGEHFNYYANSPFNQNGPVYF